MNDLTPIVLTITADDGTDLDVTVTPTDPPDRAAGLLTWQYDVDAGRPLSDAEARRVEWAVRELRP